MQLMEHWVIWQKSTFVPETIFGRSIRLKQTGWTIQTHSDYLTEPDVDLN